MKPAIFLFTMFVVFIGPGCSSDMDGGPGATLPVETKPAAPIQINELQFFRKLTRCSPAGPRSFHLRYDYIDSGSWIGIRIPVNEQKTNFIYAASSARDSQEPYMYAVKFHPEHLNAESFSGLVEWLDFQTCTFYGVHYTENQQDKWMAPIKVPFERDSAMNDEMTKFPDDAGKPRKIQYSGDRQNARRALFEWWCDFIGSCEGYHRFEDIKVPAQEIPQKLGVIYSEEYKPDYVQSYGSGGFAPGLGSGVAEGLNPLIARMSGNRFSIPKLISAPSTIWTAWPYFYPGSLYWTNYLKFDLEPGSTIYSPLGIVEK